MLTCEEFRLLKPLGRKNQSLSDRLLGMDTKIRIVFSTRVEVKLDFLSFYPEKVQFQLMFCTRLLKAANELTYVMY